MKKKRKQRYSFWRRNSLSLTFALLLLLSLAGQIITGHKEFNRDMQETYGQAPVGMLQYLRTGHFIAATFENWESEFLQMGLYVLLTVFLRQQGSAESNPIEPEPAQRFTQQSPRMARRSGWQRTLYENSLSLAFLLLFLSCFSLHLWGSWRQSNLEQSLKGQPLESLGEFLGGSKVWFESFQNWQSEFLAVLSIVVLSIFLRQKGSPESKDVAAPHSETGG